MQTLFQLSGLSPIGRWDESRNETGTEATENHRVARNLELGLTHMGTGVSDMGLCVGSKVLGAVMYTKAPKTMADMVWECRISRNLGLVTYV